MSGRLHLDTNALIALSDPAHPVFQCIERRLEEGWTAGTDAVAWHEYVRGPMLAEDRERVLLILENRVSALTRDIAERAAKLFNATGRRRASTADCLIAAACVQADAELVTDNASDFAAFTKHGMKLCVA